MWHGFKAVLLNLFDVAAHFDTYQQVAQKMKLLKRGKRSDASFRMQHVVTALALGLWNPQ